ncbi:MAG: CRISPR-associated protein Cas4 [Bacteroidetes bacterium RIFOXYA12_FULL_35_11]|nr:MAG: CRISPR-associated protein Cas4 [Bacteroidetes bacterium GWF2_35_48]OFY76322.1 MAG: CRISPR-associated protein Cas4 [Bacteroidetes bacterium RIFOXYA12_FULL_35_11]OFY97575.1 MAG: CRISPR-associated protein Cas4 [Bacteroidetes bacterium RIFOXYB2_FULL_35_7]OFZ04631.1 MAG: CRISPR-associated protein Cas4 [Bacteroidetes bacterium RIFOXYC12_FULL_35_7]
MNITGTHIHYYFLCRRKLWLFATGINMEHTSDLVYEGKLIHETSYPQRSEKYEEIEIEGIKIDFYDAKNKIIHETKKSDKVEIAHEWQLKYYIYVLLKNGVEGVTGILEYPALRKTDKIVLSSPDIEEIETIKQKITEIINSEICPVATHQKICNKCSYHDFCWSAEF